eukprot:7519003-Pyramimonas_sp.AAC.1
MILAARSRPEGPGDAGGSTLTWFAMAFPCNLSGLALRLPTGLLAPTSSCVSGSSALSRAKLFTALNADLACLVKPSDVMAVGLLDILGLLNRLAEESAGKLL